MGLAPTTTEELEKLVEHLRRIGVAHFERDGLVLTLVEPQAPETKQRETAEGRGRVYGLTPTEQIDRFGEVVDPPAEEK